MTTDTDRLLSLARECGHWNGVTVEMNDVGLVAYTERIRQDERERTLAALKEWDCVIDSEASADNFMQEFIRSSGTSKGTAHV